MHLIRLTACIVIMSFVCISCTSMNKGFGYGNQIIQVQGPHIVCGIDSKTGNLLLIESNIGGKTRRFMNEPVGISIRNEYTNVVSVPSSAQIETHPDSIIVRSLFTNPNSKENTLTVTENWKTTQTCVATKFTFEGTGEQTGHEVIIEFPILFPDAYIFTPSERGIISVAEYPSYRPTPYANAGCSESQRHYVLPLVSVFDPGSDSAVTIALPPDSNIPALQVEWADTKTLRIRLGHRGMGRENPTSFTLLFYAHEADYRSVIKAYSDEYPSYFKPIMPTGKYDGTFYYHYITNHPPFDEMERQHVNNIWAGHFWSPYFGEFIPEENEWYPFHYADKSIPALYHVKMSVGRMNDFVHEMLEHGIGTYAYHCFTEFGGKSGQFGTDEIPEERLQNEFKDNVVKDIDGNYMRSFSNSVVMNPGRGTPYNEQLRKITRRYLERVPDIQGFTVDRLDWACPQYVYNRYACDFSKYDGLTMIGNRKAANMAIPVAEVIQDIAEITHKANKRIFINQFWRIELTKNVDGYVSEFDYTRGFMYFSPYRPLSAWCSVNYKEDNQIQFEAQMKRRLQVAMFPHMIAKEFPIIQQGSNPRSAALLEILAPLFDTLISKQQVLIPQCVSATGANDVNLYVNGEGNYVIPVTSRIRFLSRGCRSTEPASITLNIPDARNITWAHVYSADVPPYKATVTKQGSITIITAERHGSSSMIVAGKGEEPNLKTSDSAQITKTREQFLSKDIVAEPQAERPELGNIQRFVLRVSGDHLGETGKTLVYADGIKLGELLYPTSDPSTSGYTSDPCKKYFVSEVAFELPEGIFDIPQKPPVLEFVYGDEGTWFAPEYVDLLAIPNEHDGLPGHSQCFRIAEWKPEFTNIKPKNDGRKPNRLPLGEYTSIDLKWTKLVVIDY